MQRHGLFRNKLSVTDASGNGLVYQGSLVYQKQNHTLLLESAAVEGGRIVASHSSGGKIYKPQYYLTDHLGSTRVVIDGASETPVTYDYYPFGKRWEDAGTRISENRYLYSGEEWQPVGGVNMLDHGDRMYDDDLGRWRNVDLYAEIYSPYSPYAYCINNPLKHVDVRGRNPIPIIFGALALSDMALIGTGVITTGLILHVSQEDGSFELNSSIKSKFNPGWGNQQRGDRAGKEALDRSQANVQKSINDNFPDPDDYDPNNTPKFRKGKKGALILAALTYAGASLVFDENSRLMFIYWYNQLLGEDEEGNEQSPQEEPKSEDEKEETEDKDDSSDATYDEQKPVLINPFFTRYSDYLKQNFPGIENSNH